MTIMRKAHSDNDYVKEALFLFLFTSNCLILLLFIIILFSSFLRPFNTFIFSLYFSQKMFPVPTMYSDNTRDTFQNTLYHLFIYLLFNKHSLNYPLAFETANINSFHLSRLLSFAI